MQFVLAILGSNAVCELVKQILSRKSASNVAILSLLHDRIYNGCTEYIHRGHITTDELDNMTKLWVGYSGLGGNGTGEELYNRVKNLPLE